ASVAAAHAQGAAFWPLALARELEDAILHLRANEPEIGLVVFRTEGDAEGVLGHDALIGQNDWLMREVRHYLKRALKRIDVTSRGCARSSARRLQPRRRTSWASSPRRSNPTTGTTSSG